MSFYSVLGEDEGPIASMGNADDVFKQGLLRIIAALLSNSLMQRT